MSWELNRPLFRRLVQLYFLGFAFAVPVLVFEVLDPRWSFFTDEFDALVTERFGKPDPVLEEATFWVGVASLAWHLVSAVGLFWYKRWARLGFWMSILPFWAIMLLPGYSTPTYSSPWLDTLTAALESVFGAIFLLSYSRDHGGAWFGSPAQQLSETN